MFSLLEIAYCVGSCDAFKAFRKLVAIKYSTEVYCYENVLLFLRLPCDLFVLQARVFKTKFNNRIEKIEIKNPEPNSGT